MIELLLQAEDAPGCALVDRAEHLYRRAIGRDPQNAIAAAGLADPTSEPPFPRLPFSRYAAEES